MRRRAVCAAPLLQPWAALGRCSYVCARRMGYSGRPAAPWGGERRAQSNAAETRAPHAAAPGRPPPRLPAAVRSPVERSSRATDSIGNTHCIHAASSQPRLASDRSYHFVAPAHSTPQPAAPADGPSMHGLVFGLMQPALNRLVRASAPRGPAPPAAAAARAARRGTVAVHASAFLRPGPHTVQNPVMIKAPLGVSPSGPVEVQIEAYIPAGAPPGPGGRWPLALLSPGFLLNSSFYRSYAASLASWGFAVGLTDLLSDGLLDDTLSVVSRGGGAHARAALHGRAHGCRMGVHRCAWTRVTAHGHAHACMRPCTRPCAHHLLNFTPTGVPAPGDRRLRARQPPRPPGRRLKRAAGRPLARRQAQRPHSCAGEIAVMLCIVHDSIYP